MPSLTGVPILDVFVYSAGVFAFATTMGVAVMKFLDILRGKKNGTATPYGRRATDLEDLRDTVHRHDIQLATLNTEIVHVGEKVSEVCKNQETQRREHRENFRLLFNKIDALSGKPITRIEDSGGD